MEECKRNKPMKIHFQVDESKKLDVSYRKLIGGLLNRYINQSVV